MKNPRKVIRRMGFVRDQEGIMNRYIREKLNWDQHLENTREFINSCFTHTSAESVAVLGSGWLLDVPIHDLEKRFKHIFLVDINHPPQIRKKVAEMKNVELVEADLSGGAVEQVWQFAKRQEKEHRRTEDLLERITLSPPLSRISPDAIISVNLLNQLDIILCEFLEKQGYFEHEPADRFRSFIQSFHLEWITATSGCLVTDTTEISKDLHGTETQKELLHVQLPPGHRTGRWSWEFDTRGTYLPGTRVRMEVQAVEWT